MTQGYPRQPVSETVADYIPYYEDSSWEGSSATDILIETLSSPDNLYIENDYIIISKLPYPNQHKVSYLLQSIGSSTSYLTDDILNLNRDNVEKEIKRLFMLAENTTFEEGMINEFSIRLEKIIEVYGGLALQHIQYFILKEKTSITVAMETLRYIGNFDTNVWLFERRQLLEKCLLESRFVWVRDGAGLGLSYLDDSDSIPILRKAIDKESNDELREDLIQVLEQLEDTLKES